jgi:replicative DNA helicase
MAMQDLVSEKAILAGICQHGVNGLNEVGDLVGDHSFSDPKNKVLFTCLKNVLENQSNVDFASIVSEGSKLSCSDIINRNSSFVEELFSFKVDLDSLRNFSSNLKKVALINTAQSLLQKTYEDLNSCSGDTIDEIMAKIETPITDLSLGLDTEETTLLFDDIDEHVDYLAEGQVDIVGVSTSYPLIDKAMGGGTRRGSITLWGCRTGVGKNYFRRYDCKT